MASSAENGMMKILLTGAEGQVGWELNRSLAPLGQVTALDRRGMDLANPRQVRDVIRQIRPDLIVNAAAYTAVDKAEEEIEMAAAVNATAPGVMAEEAEKLQAPLVHFSTDYIFSGDNGGKPYSEEDEPDPRNIYGKTKLAGERAIQKIGAAHLIFRASWVYGARGENFLLTIQRLAKERDTLRIVSDQTGAPTWCASIASAVAAICAKIQADGPGANYAGFEKVSGVYHLTCQGETTWHGFTQAILKETSGHRRPKVEPIATSSFPTPAARPKNSLLSNAKVKKTFGVEMPSWREALHSCLSQTDIGE